MPKRETGTAAWPSRRESTTATAITVANFASSAGWKALPVPAIESHR
jgi:hypothetical protein